MGISFRLISLCSECQVLLKYPAMIRARGSPQGTVCFIHHSRSRHHEHFKILCCQFLVAPPRPHLAPEDIDVLEAE